MLQPKPPRQLLANRCAAQIVYGRLLASSARRSTHDRVRRRVSRAAPPPPPRGPAPSRRYERRRPEKTPLHKVVSENLESWLECRDRAERPVPGYVEDELRGYLECGLLCFGFARAVCTNCRTGFVVAFSCKGRGICPSCNGRHMPKPPPTSRITSSRPFPCGSG